MKALSVLTAAALAVSGNLAMAQDKAALAEEGKALMQEFGGALKAELQAAMKSGGPVDAIAVCNVKAPMIAEKVSKESGWTVARSSHKLRNPKNAPDDYTAAAIEEFLKRQESGEKADQLVKAEIVEEDGQQVFRMVKAIPTGEVCLACHGGDNVEPPVVEALAELYPEDKARGFEMGQMRGVFTLRKPLN
ncbi:hypothetical protein AVO45_06940 [Ruegeria marisrubri]|uniref:Tll0287-like domain-containing protein n=1 Tax=Ruegeria marisrubri TaxID=1685379 RepID=A0A0X3U5A3_9RHOB|nr:DUF3365 domain-containing protein [Ruegeria marisrubri]KUJ80760.1 hypothetical protein AVO45_06940 [Ruegeria marisrubri]